MLFIGIAQWDELDRVAQLSGPVIRGLIANLIDCFDMLRVSFFRRIIDGVVVFSVL